MTKPGRSMFTFSARLHVVSSGLVPTMWALRFSVSSAERAIKTYIKVSSLLIPVKYCGTYFGPKSHTSYTFHWRFMSALICVYLHFRYIPPCTVCVDGCVVCVFMQTCYLDSCIPVIWAQARIFWEADRYNKEEGKDEMKKREEQKKLQDSSFLWFLPSQGLFLSPLRNHSHKQADCDVIACLFFSFSSILLTLPPPGPFHCSSKIKIEFFFIVLELSTKMAHHVSPGGLKI